MPADYPTINLPVQPTANQLVPSEGPKMLGPVILDWSTTLSYLVDLYVTMSQQKMSIIQTLYIDNSNNANPATVTTGIAGQAITCPAGVQGYFPALVPSQQAKFTIATSGMAGSTTIYFLNMPLPAMIWGNSTGGTQNVSDTILDALVQNGLFNNLPWVQVGGDKFKPTLRSGVALITKANNAPTNGAGGDVTIITGSPEFFIDGYEIYATGIIADATGGLVSVELVDNTTVIAEYPYIVPTSANAALAGLNVPIGRVDGWNYVSPNVASALKLRVQAASTYVLDAGSFYCVARVGLTALLG